MVVSREALIRTRFSTVVCAPVLTAGDGLTTQIEVGEAEGLKHPSWIMCDGLTSMEKSRLTVFVGSLSAAKIQDLDRALRLALDL